MKKIGIITHYDVPNHGAQLQLYGLKKQLNEFGYDARALKFQKNFDFMGGPEVEKKYRISVRSIPIYLKYMIENGVDRTFYNIKKRKIISRFQKKYNLLGEYYSEAKDIDIAVIGSDEIFSIEAGPNPWYYGIGVPCEYQISYAASFGPTTVEMIKDHHVEGLIEAGMKNLNYISVRDRNSANIVNNYSDKDVEIVCDPVLLYGYMDELSEEKIKEFRKKHKEKYCIIYSYDYNMNDEKTVKSIRNYAKKNGLKIYSLAYFHRWCDKNINLDPLEVFEWFACSEMVFTDTFHGTVLSLVSGNQFVTKVRGNANKLDFLLEQYGVMDRKVKDFSDINEIVDRYIDYKEVNRKIEEIRKKSSNYLEKVLKIHD